MTIDIGDGKKDIIKIFDKDNPYEVAFEFCAKHNLPNEVSQALA